MQEFGYTTNFLFFSRQHFIHTDPICNHFFCDMYMWKMLTNSMTLQLYTVLPSVNNFKLRCKTCQPILIYFLFFLLLLSFMEYKLSIADVKSTLTCNLFMFFQHISNTTIVRFQHASLSCYWCPNFIFQPVSSKQDCLVMLLVWCILVGLVYQVPAIFFRFQFNRKLVSSFFKLCNTYSVK